MILRLKTLASLYVLALSCLAQDAAPPPKRPLLNRVYRDGETLVYRMKGLNDNWRYEIQASGVVKKNAAGKYVEEFSWSQLVSNGAPVTLPSAATQFRQALSLDLAINPSAPNLAGVEPSLIGPITDLLTFYADLWLPARLGRMMKPGDHAYQKYGTPSSWADGAYVVLGEDSIDFDMTLESVDQSKKTAQLLVRHVPPEKQQIHLPAAWMQQPAGAAPDNWVQVSKRDGKFIAAAGKETFDVHIEVDLTDGKILSGTIENPVETRERVCEDAALTDCGEPRPHRTFRKIGLTLVRE